MLARRPPNAADVTHFSRDLKSVRDELSTVEGSVVDTLLTRLHAGGVALSELTDEEIALLREDVAVAQQIRLRIT
jgi:hypothetical protein